MKIGGIVKVSLPHQKRNLYDGIRDGELPTETGDSLFPDEIGLILETYCGKQGDIWCKILTPRNTIGWIHEFYIKDFLQ